MVYSNVKNGKENLPQVHYGYMESKKICQQKSFGSVKKYEDFYFYSNFNGSKLTWMMMPDDNGLVASALLDGLVPKKSEYPEQVEFILWTRETRDEPEKKILNQKRRRLRFEKFKTSCKTVVLIHGFTDVEKKPEFFNTLVPAFLEQDDYNIIGVNWRNLSRIPWYGQAVKNSVFVGNLTASAIKYAKRKSGEKGLPIHVVAHNLGTLVAAVAAKRFKRKIIDRITGLDPPYILANDLPINRKLDKEDARLVEIIHTSGDYIGINAAVGHRDFYPNNGKWPQPGCVYDIADRCSMRRAYYYYAEAVSNNRSFLATKCSSYRKYLRGKCRKQKKIPLFNFAPRRLRGNFYLRTNSKSPYSKGRRQ